MRTYWPLAAILAVLSGGAAQGGIIYDNGAPDYLTGLYSDASDLPGGAQFVADDFVLARGSNTITDIHWWGGWDIPVPGPTTDFVISIYGQDGGAPASTALHTINVGAIAGTDTGNDLLDGTSVYAYATFIDPITLNAGETYYLSIVNQTPEPNADWYWANHERPGGNGYFRIDPTDPWVVDAVGVDTAFYLTDDAPIPEPTTMTLIGLGVAGLALRSRTAQSARN